MKRCAKCGQTKPVSEYHRDTRGDDRLIAQCKACRSEHDREYRKANSEEIRRRDRERYEAHKEERRESARKYGAAHREERREYNRKYRETHMEEERKRAAKWKQENPEKVRDDNIKWRTGNPEKSKLFVARWNASHPEKRRAIDAKRRALKAEVTVGDLTAIQRVYDIATNGERVRCYLCGNAIPKGERHVDHIVPLSKGGLHTASNLAVACAACNLSKHAKLPEEVGILI